VRVAMTVPSGMTASLFLPSAFISFLFLVLLFLHFPRHILILSNKMLWQMLMGEKIKRANHEV
jgi:hypothetical protein